MTAKDFEALVRRMRSAQKRYYKLDPRTDMVLKTEALVTAKQLEREVDLAEVDDPANLETEFPRGPQLADG